MTKPCRALAFDVDPVSSELLRQALPGWQIDSVSGATVETLHGDWNPGAVDLLVVGMGSDFAETLALCRFLAFCTYYSGDFPEPAGKMPTEVEQVLGIHRPVDAPVLALVPAEKEMFAKILAEAGAHACLLLPLRLGELTATLLRLRAGEQHLRHLLNPTEETDPDVEGPVLCGSEAARGAGPAGVRRDRCP